MRRTKNVSAASRAGHPRREFSVIIERDAEGWYVGTVPALRGCHTQARSLDSLMERIREAIGVCLDADEPPRAAEFIGIRRVAVEG